MPQQEYFAVRWRIPPGVGTADTVTPRMRGVPWRPFTKGTFAQGIFIERVNASAGSMILELFSEAVPNLFAPISMSAGVLTGGELYSPPIELPFALPAGSSLGSTGIYPKISTSGAVLGRDLTITLNLSFGA